MKDFLRVKGFATQDSREHGQGSDAGLLRLLETEMLGKLSDSRNWPFVLLILTATTHPPFGIPGGCRDHLKAYPKIFRSFTCFDDSLRHFAEVFEKSKLFGNTEMIVYGDHLAMQGSGFLSERNLSVFFPFRKQDDKWKQGISKVLSYYDFAPTVLELLGIDFKPSFPFGFDMFGPRVGTLPQVDELKLIYGIVSGDVNATRVRCHNKHGFCQHNEF
jgi:phosphoglycerol transferase MdoB-like AlkP superfamily enzyme